MEKLADRIADWIKEQVEKSNSKGAIVGLSGGLDSSIVAVLCKRTFPDGTLGIIMPCFSNPEDIEHARLLADRFDIDTKEVDLSNIFENFLGVIEDPDYVVERGRMEFANLKPRLRMTTLYYFANKLNYLVVGTGNKSELNIGYFTKYGDGGVDILPIGDLLKTQVKELARYLEIPDEIMEKSPSAGLWEGQTDEGEMGISYEELGRTLDGIETSNPEGLNQEIVEKVRGMINRSEHKRKKPPICKINS